MNYFIRALSAVVGLFVAASALQAQSTMFDSTGMNPGYYAPLKATYYEFEAQRFTTNGDGSPTLTGISLYLDYVGPGTAWNPSVTIYDNAGTNPLDGNVAGSFTSDAGVITGDPFVMTFPVVPITFSGSVALAANTTYWVVFSWNNSGADTELGLADRYTGTGTGAWLTPSDYVYADLQTNGWHYETDSALKMTMTGTSIPEPSTYAMVAGLGALGLVMWRRRVAVG